MRAGRLGSRHSLLFSLVAAAAALAPLFAHAADPAQRVARVAFINPYSPATVAPGSLEFWARLHELGWVQGQNLIVETRSAEGRIDRLPALMADVVAKQGRRHRDPRDSRRYRCQECDDGDSDRCPFNGRSGRYRASGELGTARREPHGALPARDDGILWQVSGASPGNCSTPFYYRRHLEPGQQSLSKAGRQVSRGARENERRGAACYGRARGERARWRLPAGPTPSSGCHSAVRSAHNYSPA